MDRNLGTSSWIHGTGQLASRQRLLPQKCCCNDAAGIRHRVHCSIKVIFVDESKGSNVPQNCVIIHTIQQYLGIFASVTKARKWQSKPLAFLHNQMTLNSETMTRVCDFFLSGRTMFYMMMNLLLCFVFTQDKSIFYVQFTNQSRTIMINCVLVDKAG